MTEEERALLQRLLELDRDQSKDTAPSQRNTDGTYGAPPEGVIVNPYTGQMTERALLRGNLPETTGGQAFGRGTRQGVYFNFADEAQGVADALSDEGGTAAERYAFGRELARAKDEQARDAHGGAYTAGQITGGVLAAGASAPYTGAAATLGQAAGRGAAAGAVEGALYGAGRGESVDDRTTKALTDALVGASVGAAAPYAMEGGRQAFNAVVRNPASGLARTVTGTPSGRRVAEMAEDVFRRSGKTPAQVQREVTTAAAQGQPEFRAMDALGTPATDRVRGIGRAGGEGADELRDFLLQRQVDQRARAIDYVNDAYMPADRSTARQLRGELFSARQAEADKLYDSARQLAGAVNLNGPLKVIDQALGRNEILGETALRNSDVGEKLIALRDSMQRGGEQLVDFQRVLEVKHDLFTVMNNMRQKGITVPRSLSEVYGALDESLEAASEGYRAANDSFRAASARIEAVDTGRGFMGQRPEDSIAEFSALAPDAQDGARAGYGDSVLQTIQGRKGFSGNIANEVVGSERERALVDVLASDPGLLSQRMARETAMFRNYDAALGNSSTAQNAAQVAEIAGDSQVPAVEGAREVLNFEFGNALMRLMRSLAPTMTGQSPATRRELARVLMSQDPEAAMRPLLEKQAQSAATRRIVEALVRNNSVQQGGPMIQGGR